MKNYTTVESIKVPKVDFNAKTGVMSIAGRSTPENAEDLFKPMIDWAKEYMKQPASQTKIIIDLEYYNSSSAKYIIRFLDLFNIFRKQNAFGICWKYYDEEGMEAGKDFSEALGIPIELINGGEEYPHCF